MQMTEVPQAEQAIIFINYRRTDAGWPADLIASKLEHTFGKPRVFLDVRGLDAGDEFPAELEEKLCRATILIVLIGEGWLQIADKYGRRRLDQKDDRVRKEIRIGLQRKSCRVIPILIDHAKLPDESTALPEDIAGLLLRNRIQVRQANSEDDIEALSRQLEKAGFQRLPDSRELFSRQIPKLLDHLAEKGDILEERKDAALWALLGAAVETKGYLERLERNEARNQTQESELVKLWAKAAVPVRYFDKDLAQSCLDRVDDWIRPEPWISSDIQAKRTDRSSTDLHTYSPAA